ncbi:MAG: alpha/beta hydrolase [Amphiplicatus sp.]
MTDVDPKTRMLLDMIAALGEPPLSETSVSDFRARRARGRALINPTSPELPVILDTHVDGAAGSLKARIYDTLEGEHRPTLIYFHGGGFCYGDLDSHDPLCRRLAAHGGMRVIAVDYRLAPETPFPGPVDDAIAALESIATKAARYGADPARLAIGGDSAGACLSTIAARHAARTDGPALKFQLLIYPVVQEARATPSREKFAAGYFLTSETMGWFRDHYLGKDFDPSDEWVSPLLSPPPAGLAPALVITAGFDPLLDEGRDYAETLKAAGIPVDYVEYPDQIHGFFSFTAFSTVAEEAIASAACATAKALG